MKQKQFTQYPTIKALSTGKFNSLGILLRRHSKMKSPGEGGGGTPN